MDVYTDWYDATEEVNQGQHSDSEGEIAEQKKDNDDFIEDDDEDVDAEYSD